MKQAFNYSLKIFFATMLLGSVLLGCEGPSMFPVLFLFGITYCAASALPSYILFLIASRIIKEIHINSKYCKLFLSLIALPLNFIPLFFWYPVDQWSIHTLYVWPFIAASIICIWYFKLPVDYEETPVSNDF